MIEFLRISYMIKFNQIFNHLLLPQSHLIIFIPNMIKFNHVSQNAERNLCHIKVYD